jgi:hypothetical protein
MPFAVVVVRAVEHTVVS